MRRYVPQTHCAVEIDAPQGAIYRRKRRVGNSGRHLRLESGWTTRPAREAGMDAKIKRDLFLATTSNVAQKMIGYVVIVVLARHLDKAKMGEFFFATTFASFFALCTELGTSNYLIRRVAEDAGNALSHLSEVIAIRLPLFGVSFLLLTVSTLLVKPDLLAIVLLSASYLFLQDLYYSFGAFFLGLRRVADRLLTALGAQFLLLGLVLAAVRWNGSLEEILACYILANLFLVGIAVAFVRKKIGRSRLRWKLELARTVLRASLPFFALTILGLLHFKIDTVMLGVMRSYTVVATYEASAKLLEVSRFVVRPAAMIFFPICAGLVARGEWPQFRAVFRKLLLVAGGLGVAVGGVVILSAGFIVPAIFGSRYDDSVPILRILYLTVPSLYLGFVFTFLANALHLEAKAAGIMLASLVLNILLNCMAIPFWGAYGAAWSTLVSETFLAAGCLKVILGNLRMRLFPDAGILFPSRADAVASETNGMDGLIDHDASL